MANSATSVGDWHTESLLKPRSGTTCCLCGATLRSTHYYPWRGRAILMGVTGIEYAHRSCVLGEGTMIVPTIRAEK